MQSEELFQQSKSLVPGGVHSPVRSFKNLQRDPIFVQRAQGAYLHSVEGQSYIDFCMSFGPLVLGHRDEQVESALHQALERGWTYGACEPYSLELAQEITSKIPFIDQIRFVNSGTEAVMTALRIARGVTQKNKIIKFNGCYHGHTDSMLIKAGSGLAGQAEASSKGVPQSISQDTLIFELGETEALKKILADPNNDIAAVIIEPLPANNGLLIQTPEFLRQLRQWTSEAKSLLIFDEVISGFRVGFDGMAGVLDLVPDLVTYGKVIGGGLPVGAVAGKQEFMSHLAPEGDVYQAGTLSANPLAMVGGLATLKQLTQELYSSLEQQTKKIVILLQDFLDRHQDQFGAFHIQQYASLFWIAPGRRDIYSIQQMPNNLWTGFKPLYAELLKRGLYLAPNPYEVCFVSKAHDQQVIQQLEKALCH